MDNLVLFVALFALIPALIARSKGRSGFLWWIYGCALLPVAFAHAMLLSDLKGHPCPHCGKRVLKTADTCPHCLRQLVDPGVIKQLIDVDTLIEKSQRDAQAKLEVGESLTLTAEREGEGMPGRVRLDSKHGPVGYLRHFDSHDPLLFLGRRAYDARVSQSRPGKLNVTIRFYTRLADAPVEHEPLRFKVVLDP